MKYVISALSLKTSETGKYDTELKLQGGGAWPSEGAFRPFIK